MSRITHVFNHSRLIHFTCQVKSSILYQHWVSVYADGGLTRRNPGGCHVSDPATAGRLGGGAERSGHGRRSDGVLHFTAADSEKSAPCAEPDRHLWQDGKVFEAPERDAVGAG